MTHDTGVQGARPGRRGMTLLELMVAVTLLGIVFAAAIPLFQVQARVLTKQAGRLEALQTLRFAAASIERELRVAGPPSEIEAQPLLVQAHGSALTINVDLASTDTGSASAVYFDPDIPAEAATALPLARAVVLPGSGAAYPLADYANPAGEPSDAETISYWIAPDEGAARADQYALWRRVNDGDSVAVARRVIVRAGRPFFTYLQPGAGDTLRDVATNRLPALHTVAEHGAAGDTGAVALVDSIRAVRMAAEILYTDPQVGDTTIAAVYTMRILNAGLVRRATCGTAPLATALAATAKPGGIVALSWDESVDELGGEEDVERYTLFRRPAGAADWGEPFRSIPARGGPYDVDDTEVKSDGSLWQYSIMAQDCTPMNSPRAVAPTVTITN